MCLCALPLHGLLNGLGCWCQVEAGALQLVCNAAAGDVEIAGLDLNPYEWTAQVYTSYPRGAAPHERIKYHVFRFRELVRIPFDVLKVPRTRVAYFVPVSKRSLTPARYHALTRDRPWGLPVEVRDIPGIQEPPLIPYCDIFKTCYPEEWDINT